VPVLVLLPTPHAPYAVSTRAVYTRTIVVTERSADQLLMAIGQGDRDAFAELWGRFARPALTVAARILDDVAAAEDATQEAFATIWRNAARYDRARGEPTAWIYTIVRNAARDALRRRRATPVADVPEVADDPAHDPQNIAAVGLDAFHLHAALMELPERSREVIELAYYQGLSQTEIAQRIDVPLGTVKTRTRSALAQLAGRLATVVEAS
jgi:RNA polymerase sigma-70 factor (ECF subfamily)